MKGVILGVHPRVQIVDISHEVPPFAIQEGAFVLAQAYRYFPPKTVHVAVVDPGVGTTRRPLLMEAAGQYFIAPDNGVLALVMAREKHKVRCITADRYFLKPVSRTFHGRDVFAPAAAQLAKGVAPSRFGKLMQDYLRTSWDQPVRTGKRFWTGAVLKTDRFGNLITNFHVADFPGILESPFEMCVGIHVVRRLANTYGDCPPGEPCVVLGSSNYFEVVVNEDSASRKLGCCTGSPVELRWPA